jgi:nitrous oxide reductase
MFSGWTISSCVQWSLFSLCFLLPLAECSCKPKVQVKLTSFVVSSQARNQFSKPSTKMELVWWPRAARSTTCEQDRPASKIDVCMWFCISRHEDMAAL